jgi:hypothetical protein
MPMVGWSSPDGRRCCTPLLYGPVASRLVKPASPGSATERRPRAEGKGYVDAGASPPVWANSLLTTFQVPSMRASWK